MTDNPPTETSGFVQKKVGNYHLLQQIGKGTFSIVALGIHLPTNHKVAIKILQKNKIQDKTDIERINREINILKMIEHPHLAKLYEIISTKNNIYLVMSFIPGGDLFDYIFENTKLSEDVAKNLFCQIISCLEYLNRLNICHRDIKPENILLNNKKNNITMIDFGLSNFCYKHKLLKSSCGSPCYASPEMIKGEPYNGMISDIWSCGIVLYCMLVGCLPFDDDELQSLYNKILKGDFVLPSFLSSEAIDLIKQMLIVDASKRITISQIKKHKWMRDVPCLFKKISHHKKTKSIVDKDIANIIKDKYFSDDEDVTTKTICDSVTGKECDKYSACYYFYIESNGLKMNENKKSRTLSRNQRTKYNKHERKQICAININNTKNKSNNNNKCSYRYYNKKAITPKPKDLNVFVINNIFSNNNRPKGRNQNHTPTITTDEHHLSNAYSNITFSSNQSKLLSPTSIQEINNKLNLKRNTCCYNYNPVKYKNNKKLKTFTPIALRQKQINTSNIHNYKGISLKFDNSFGSNKSKVITNSLCPEFHNGNKKKNNTPKNQKRKMTLNENKRRNVISLNEDKPFVNMNMTFNQSKTLNLSVIRRGNKRKSVEKSKIKEGVDCLGKIGKFVYKENVLPQPTKQKSKNKEKNKQMILKKLFI